MHTQIEWREAIVKDPASPPHIASEYQEELELCRRWMAELDEQEAEMDRIERNVNAVLPENVALCEKLRSMWDAHCGGGSGSIKSLMRLIAGART